jgi:hypothetical protein
VGRINSAIGPRRGGVATISRSHSDLPTDLFALIGLSRPVDLNYKVGPGGIADPGSRRWRVSSAIIISLSHKAEAKSQ